MGDMKVRHIDHIGVIVNDLAAARDFFVDLGFIAVGEASLQGEFVDRVTGLDGVRSEIVMLEAPDGKVNLELSKFHYPESPGEPAPVHALGFRHIALVVDDIDGIVAKLQEKGMEVINGVSNYKDVYKCCYVRGPEGMILELAEEVG